MAKIIGPKGYPILYDGPTAKKYGLGKYATQSPSKFRRRGTGAASPKKSVASKDVRSPTKTLPKHTLKKPDYINPHTTEKVQLTENQKKAIAHMDKNDTLGVFLPPGSGKTLISLIVANNYLSKYPSHNVVCISPAGLVTNFKKEMKIHKIGTIDERYHFYSFEKFLSLAKKGEGLKCENTLMIIDEGHQTRNPKSKKFQSLMKCVTKTKKVMIMTGSPYVNYIKDFISLINILHKSYIVGPTVVATKYILPYHSLQTREIFEDTRKINKQILFVSKFLKDKIIFAVQDRSDPNFPTFDITTKKIPMTKEYERDFAESISSKLVFSNPKSFYNGYRRAVNKVSNSYYSRKLEYISKVLKSHQSLIYSNWLEYGVDCVETTLNNIGVDYGVISGSVGTSDRTKITKDYNSKQIQVLVYTKAGSEGLDLKNTEYVFILEPVWSYALLEQAIMRSIRYGSHKDSKNKHVKVILLALTSKNPDIKSGDILLYDIIKKKRAIQSHVGKMLELCSI